MLFCHLVITVCACTFVTCTLIKINQDQSTRVLSLYQNVCILDFIEAEDGGNGENKWSYKTCKAPVKSSPLTNRQHPTFYRLDALPVSQPTVSVHWRTRRKRLLWTVACRFCHRDGGWRVWFGVWTAYTASRTVSSTAPAAAAELSIGGCHGDDLTRIDDATRQQGGRAWRYTMTGTKATET